MWCEKYTVILGLLISIARFLLVWSLHHRFLTGMPYIWIDDLLVCVTDDSCRRVAETFPPRRSVTLFQCEVAVLIICWHVVFVTLTLCLSSHYFEN